MAGNLILLLDPLEKKKKNKADVFGCKIEVLERLYMATENGNDVEIFDGSSQWFLGALIPKQVARWCFVRIWTQ